MILRSDYMLHGDPTGDGADRGVSRNPPQPHLFQIELNTIAASFASLSSKVSQLHVTLAQRFPALRRHLWERRGRPHKLRLDDALPPNPSLTRIAVALAAAHKSYGVDDALVLFVVQPDERNAVDLELLRSTLWANHGVRVICRTLAQLEIEARLVGSARKLMLGGKAADTTKVPAKKVAVAYFRAGYTPDDFPSGRECHARLTVERSHAIKCPSIECHLAGAKRVQQQLSVPGELERFVSEKEAALLRQVFAGLWALDGPDRVRDASNDAEREAAAAIASARAAPEGFVMKPQREGGGHNLFGDELAKTLGSLSRPQRASFILMQRLRPPAYPAVLVCEGQLQRGEAVSELGVYSTYVRAANGKVLVDGAVGHLLRSKLVGTDEGGVAAGYACLSSPLASLAAIAAHPKKG